MKDNSASKVILLTPGPVPISPIVQERLSLDMIHHRSHEFLPILTETRSDLKTIFQTKEEVHILNSNGSGAMEASISNLFSEGDEVLHICCGKFGERWLGMSKEYKLKTHHIQTTLGQAVQIKDIKDQLQKFPKIRAIFVQACETSTAVFNPIEDIAKLTKDNSNLLLIVDAITALIITPIAMDEWGIDVLIGGSQKSFAIPAGLSFIALSQKAQEFQKTSKLPCYYFDLAKDKKSAEKKQTAFSTNVAFVRALQGVLQEYLSQGLENVRARYKALQESTFIFCQKLELEIFSKSPGPSLTAILLPSQIDGHALRKWMEEQGVMIGGGQDTLAGKIIRFGHMGYISKEDQLKGLSLFGQALLKQDSTLFTAEKLEQTVEEVKQYLTTHLKG